MGYQNSLMQAKHILPPMNLSPLTSSSFPPPLPAMTCCMLDMNIPSPINLKTKKNQKMETKGHHNLQCLPIIAPKKNLRLFRCAVTQPSSQIPFPLSPLPHPHQPTRPGTPTGALSNHCTHRYETLKLYKPPQKKKTLNPNIQNPKFETFEL